MLKIKLLSSLTKVFPDEEPETEEFPLSILQGEVASVQIAVCGEGTITVAAKAPGFQLRVREVRLVPSALPCYASRSDDNYLRKTPGMFPDWLKELPADGSAALKGWWKSFWIDAVPEDSLEGGEYPLTVCVTQQETGETYSARQSITYVKIALPEQTLMHTQWFHTDCLADYYRVEVFSEEYWRIVENYMRSASRLGINMLLTPIFTPPLDTAIGGERTTVQLVDVTRKSGVYTFRFDKLKRWIQLALRCGIRYFEISHLYTQWGAKAAPKVMAAEDGEYKRIFGWETEATGDEYKAFLTALLPQLAEKLRAWGVADRCWFHVSDEPQASQIESYAAAKQQVKALLPEFPFMDALSDYEFYKTGNVEHPVVSTNHIDTFLAHKVPGLWTYYCCGQCQDVANRFMAMPSARNRILGVQLYLFDIAGFLQWGFNFYNTAGSTEHIDPYAVTDGREAWPSGDSFMVYPNANGTPDESIRYMVFRQALCDLRAYRLLETKIGTEAAHALIQQGVEPITFSSYPHDAAYLLNLRARVNEAISRA